MRRTWLIFSQAVTVAVAVLFVVATLKPDWLPRRSDGSAVTVLPPLPYLDFVGLLAGCRLLAATESLLALAHPVLGHFDARKRGAGLMAYDDLIATAERVLRDPGSAWVLFKLDGGLDHVLLDEAQDSNPAQWRIAAALTEEFFAGQGAELAGRGDVGPAARVAVDARDLDDPQASERAGAAAGTGGHGRQDRRPGRCAWTAGCWSR